MSAGIKLTLDPSDLIRWGTAATRLIENQIRSAVDKSARAARRDAIKEMAANSGVPAARFRQATPLIRPTGPGRIIATFTVGRAGNSVRGPGGKQITSYTRGTPVDVASFVHDGGKFPNLALKRGFVIRANGGLATMTRVGKGRGAIKKVFAASPHSMMKGEKVVKRVWQATAEQSLRRLAPEAVQAALDLRPATGMGGGE